MFLAFIVFYTFFIAKDLIFGVKIRNVNLSDGAKMTEKIVKITGKAKNSIDLRLNGRSISIDQEGNFNETIAFLPGYNIVNIKAVDDFGNTDEKNYKLIYENNE